MDETKTLCEIPSVTVTLEPGTWIRVKFSETDGEVDVRFDLDAISVVVDGVVYFTDKFVNFEAADTSEAAKEDEK